MIFGTVVIPNQVIAVICVRHATIIADAPDFDCPVIAFYFRKVEIPDVFF